MPQESPMADRHSCPVCGEGGVTTIHDDLYFCNADDCGVSYNPLVEGGNPWYPIRGAIGFCPRCEANARGQQDDCLPELFECPECAYEWADARVDGVTLALRLHGSSDLHTSPSYDFLD